MLGRENKSNMNQPNMYSHKVKNVHFNINRAKQVHVRSGIYMGGNILFVVKNILDPSSHSTYKILIFFLPQQGTKGPAHYGPRCNTQHSQTWAPLEPASHSYHCTVHTKRTGEES